jgi:hypothetical protein
MDALLNNRTINNKISDGTLILGCHGTLLQFIFPRSFTFVHLHPFYNNVKKNYVHGGWQLIHGTCLAPPCPTSLEGENIVLFEMLIDFSI